MRYFFLSRDRRRFEVLHSEWYAEISQQRSEFSCWTRPKLSFLLCHWTRFFFHVWDSCGSTESSGANAPIRKIRRREMKNTVRTRLVTRLSLSEPRLAKLWLRSRCPSVPYIESWREGTTDLKRDEWVWIVDKLDKLLESDDLEIFFFLRYEKCNFWKILLEKFLSSVFFAKKVWFSKNIMYLYAESQRVYI